MILLDTHIWIWWVHEDSRLSKDRISWIDSQTEGIGVSAISCWEIAKLVEYKRIELPCPIKEWLKQALNYPGVQLLELSPEISVQSTELPGEFHRDPSDQIIVATAMIHQCPLLTADKKILDYSHVETIAP